MLKKFLKKSALLAGFSLFSLHAADTVSAAPESGAQEAPQLADNTYNVIAKELMGEWVLNSAISKLINPDFSPREKEVTLIFKADKEASDRIFKIATRAKEMDIDALYEKAALENKANAEFFRRYCKAIKKSLSEIYLTGLMDFKGKSTPFALVTHYGNPSILILKPDRSVDNPRFDILNVMLAADKAPSDWINHPEYDDGKVHDNDILFIDNGNPDQSLSIMSFRAFTRKKPSPKTQ